jgi:hypothetical protein
MEQLIKKKQKKTSTSTTTFTSMAVGDEDPFEEFDRYFKSRRLEREACKNAVTWWGVSTLSPCLV